MKILTTNASGKDVFGGIHTHIQEQIVYSPKDKFYISELNRERKYTEEENKTLIKYDLESLIGTNDVRNLLGNSESFEEFNSNGEKIINEFQSTIELVKPDIIKLFGTSIPSYFMSVAAKREGKLNKTIHCYAGVLEKEIGGYNETSQELLKKIGRNFTNEENLQKVTYIFPSKLCKQTVEELHNIKIENSHVIPNGISKPFYNKKERTPPKELTLGFIGRLSAVKNPDLFLNLHEVLKEDINLKIITDLAASANKPIGKTLIRKMTDGEINYYAPRPPKELVDFYKTQISVNVVPSLFETFCNVALESLVCGTPTLLSNRAGAKEIFEEYGLDKLIFSIDNMDSFREALEEAEKNKFKIKEEVSKQIYKDFSWKNIIGKYQKIIKRVLDNN